MSNQVALATIASTTSTLPRFSSEGSPAPLALVDTCVEFHTTKMVSMKDGHEQGGHRLSNDGDHKCGATQHAGSEGVETGENGSEPPCFVNTFDEFEPYDELACDSQDASDSEDGDDCAECIVTGALQISTDGEGSTWEASNHSSPVGVGSTAVGLHSWQQPQTALQDPRSLSPTGMFAGVVVAAQGVCRPGWAGGSGHLFQVPMMAAAPPQSMPVQYAHGNCQWLSPSCPAPARSHAVAAPPPGSWHPPAARPAQAPANADAAGEHVRLVSAVRQPSPLQHNKSVPVTSLTINHLPFQMRRSQLCDLMDEMGFASRYNYVYVPCSRDKTNRGHAFINFCSPDDATEFFANWHGARIVGISANAPVLSIAVSMVQGFEAIDAFAQTLWKGITQPVWKRLSSDFFQKRINRGASGLPLRCFASETIVALYVLALFARMVLALAELLLDHCGVLDAARRVVVALKQAEMNPDAVSAQSTRTMIQELQDPCADAILSATNFLCRIQR